MKLLFKLVVYFLALVGAGTIALAAYLYFADPLGLKTLWQAAPPQATADTQAADPASSPFPNVSPVQLKVLQNLGIDVNNIPKTITPGMETCFTDTLGEDRVNQIKGGAAPTPMDILKAKSCLSK